jgi:hypothetical protein
MSASSDLERLYKKTGGSVPAGGVTKEEGPGVLLLLRPG